MSYVNMVRRGPREATRTPSDERTNKQEILDYEFPMMRADHLPSDATNLLRFGPGHMQSIESVYDEARSPYSSLDISPRTILWARLGNPGWKYRA